MEAPDSIKEKVLRDMYKRAVEDAVSNSPVIRSARAQVQVYGDELRRVEKAAATAAYIEETRIAQEAKEKQRKEKHEKDHEAGEQAKKRTTEEERLAVVSRLERAVTTKLRDVQREEKKKREEKGVEGGEGGDDRDQEGGGQALSGVDNNDTMTKFLLQTDVPSPTKKEAKQWNKNHQRKEERKPLETLLFSLRGHKVSEGEANLELTSEKEEYLRDQILQLVKATSGCTSDEANSGVKRGCRGHGTNRGTSCFHTRQRMQSWTSQSRSRSIWGGGC
jgi:hypothetical protein